MTQVAEHDCGKIGTSVCRKYKRVHEESTAAAMARSRTLRVLRAVGDAHSSEPPHPASILGLEIGTNRLLSERVAVHIRHANDA